MLTGAQAGMMSGLGSPNWAAPASVGAYAIGAGMIGGMFSAGQSGNFASGFLAAGIGSLSAGLTGPGITPEGLVTSASSAASPPSQAEASLQTAPSQARSLMRRQA